jgi:hypothetical protein
MGGGGGEAARAVTPLALLGELRRNGCVEASEDCAADVERGPGGGGDVSAGGGGGGCAALAVWLRPREMRLSQLPERPLCADGSRSARAPLPPPPPPPCAACEEGAYAPSGGLVPADASSSPGADWRLRRSAAGTPPDSMGGPEGGAGSPARRDAHQGSPRAGSM